MGEGIEGLVHISEMSAHHVELPEQVVTPGEELWVKIIDLDLERRRISLSIKQAAEGGVVAAEYQEHFGEHNYDEEGNYIGVESSEGQEAWAEYYTEHDPADPVASDGEETENSNDEETGVTEEELIETSDPEETSQEESNKDEVNETEDGIEDESEEEKTETQE